MTLTELSSLFRELRHSGITVSHLGKADPPRAFAGGDEDAAALTLAGTERTNWTFGRAAGSKLGFSIEIHGDPRWTHSTVSASAKSEDVLRSVANAVQRALRLYVAIGGVTGGGKDQEWQVVTPPSAACPTSLLQRLSIGT